MVNTLLGYGVFLLAFELLDLSPLLSNVLSYAVGLTSAFLLDRLFVFGARGAGHLQLSPCPMSFALAYAANLAVLEAMIRLLAADPRIAQLFAMVTYTLLFCVLSKWVVFRA